MASTIDLLSGKFFQRGVTTTGVSGEIASPAVFGDRTARKNRGHDLGYRRATDGGSAMETSLVLRPS
jgi:hypothetical protein